MQQQTTKTASTSDNAIKLLGEALVPGASLLMDGRVAAGALHTVVGAWARVALGPVGLALVVANSYANSTTGKNLLKQFTGNKDEKTESKASRAK